MFFVMMLLLSIVPAIVTYAWAVASLPWLARRRRPFAATLAALALVGGPLQWLVVHTHSWIVSDVQLVVSMCIVAMGMTALPLALFHGACELWARKAALAETTRERTMQAAQVTRRQIVEGASGAGLFAATGSVLGWGMVRGRHAFQLREIAVRIPGLPRVLDGYVIAQISDIHTGDRVGEREIDEGLVLVRAMRPDLVAVTGDLVDIDATFAPLIARKLSDLPSRDGIFACLGNHDYYAGASVIARSLRSAGITTLINDGLVLRGGDGGGFSLLGVDDLGSKNHGGSGPHIDRALSAVPRDLPRILLSHQPPTVDDWAGKVALQLSGHTHGGQINPGGHTTNFLFRYAAGAYSVGETTLYVNRGFGTVGPPVRVGVPPEVTRIVLVAA